MAKVESFSIKDSDKELWDRFLGLKWIERKSISELIVLAAKEYLERHHSK